MKIFIGQIYIKPGVAFPFSLHFQKWLGDALSERVEISEQFSGVFGADFVLGLRITAKEDIEKPEIKGPTVFRRNKNVEFTIFLPYQDRNYYDLTLASLLFEQLFQSVVIIFHQLGLDAEKTVRDQHQLQNEFLNTPGLLR